MLISKLLHVFVYSIYLISSKNFAVSAVTEEVCFDVSITVITLPQFSFKGFLYSIGSLICATLNSKLRCT